MWHRRVELRTAQSAAVLATAAALFAGIAVAGPAGAAPAVTARKHHHGSPIPGIKHATSLTDEPVVQADRTKPPTKVLTKNLVTGTGAAVTATSTVTVKYVGANYKTGKDFTQATWQSNKATSFTLHTVVPGFSAGLVGMKVGGRREIVIPPKYGYGTTAQGPIKKHETLVFVVDLVGVTS